MNELFGDVLDDMPWEDEILIEDQMAFANWIDEECEFLGINQATLAARLDMPTPQLSKIMSGCQNVTLRTMAKISAALGVRAVSINPSRLEQANRTASAYAYGSVPADRDIASIGLRLIRGGMTEADKKPQFETGSVPTIRKAAGG